MSLDTRRLIEAETARWARHENRYNVATTSSFANMERTLEREYYGRFLIELIQNARDAWFAANPLDRRGVVRVILHGDPPVLTVANQGIALDATVLLSHVTQFGESSKASGTSIGHKGIGLKSVLEITRCPQILSRVEAQGEFSLAVCFDPRRTERLIDRESAPMTWAAMVAEHDPEGLRTKDERLPILRFPHWMDTIPPDVLDECGCASEAFNTLVRLPYDPFFDSSLSLDRDAWLTKVRRAMSGVSDEIILLLDAFSHVLIEDRLDGTLVDITVTENERTRFATTTERRFVEVRRNEAVVSRWFLYERRIGADDGGRLAGEVVVGVRVDGVRDGTAGEDARWHPVAPEQRTFHLFFPTEIETGLPFLLHAYFEVDAGRTRFAPDSRARNEALLAELQSLVVEVVQDLVANPMVDHGSLARLFGSVALDPSDPLARDFRNGVLATLDDLPWVDTLDGQVARPRDLLVDCRPELSPHLASAFPSAYLARRCGAFHPAEPSAVAHRFLGTRPCRSLRDLLPELLTPGISGPPWKGAAADVDAGFRACMLVLSRVAAMDPSQWEAVASRVRGNPDAAFIPVVAIDAEAPRRLLSPTIGPAVFARRRLTSDPGSAAVVEPGDEIGVPRCLEMAFVPAGTVSADILDGVAASLGIRSFDTESILEQLDRVASACGESDAPSVAEFTWRMLLRESRSSFGVSRCLDAGRCFIPGRWFWCDPSHVLDDEMRRNQYRRRGLSSVCLPARDGTWRPARCLCMNADWLGMGGDEASALRSEAYSDLETLAPGPEWLLGPPDALATILPLRDEDIRWMDPEILAQIGLDDVATVPESGSEARVRLHRALLRVFVLLLGVWEIPPVEGVIGDLTLQDRGADPWEDLPGRSAWWKHVQNHLHEIFGVSYSHGRVRVAADCRLAWDLERLGDEDRVVQARALARGMPLYSGLLRAAVFCPQCGHHRTRVPGKNPPESMLGWSLRNSAWVPVVMDARPSRPRRPSDAWWLADPPDDPARIANQPRRYLPIVRRGFQEGLFLSVGGRSFEAATAEDLSDVLASLEQGFKTRCLPADPGQGGPARAAFLGLHSLVYRKLAKTGKGKDVLDRVGVLTEQGGSLVWVPRSQALYDAGRANAFRRYFSGRVPFVPLNVGEGEVAKQLGIEPFLVTAELLDSDMEDREDQSEEVAGFLGDRLPEIMALLTTIGMGGPPLDMTSDAFRERSQRIRRLRTYRVREVKLELRVHMPDGSVLSEQVGRGPDRQVFLHGLDEVFHDYQGDAWLDKLRSHLGEVVATLVENPAFADTFTLFFLAEGDAREAFLVQRGVTNLEDVRRNIRASGEMARRFVRNWWEALLRALRVSGPYPSDLPESFMRQALQASGWESGLVEKVLAAGAGEEVRCDDRVEGPLGVLEAAGVSLFDLHQELRRLGDPGLRIDATRGWFRRWKADHGAKAAFVLVSDGRLTPEAAKKRLAEWGVPESVALHVAVPVSDVLDPVARELGGVLAADLVDDQIDVALATRCGIPVEDWPDAWRRMFDEEDVGELARRCANEWRIACRVPAVTLTCAEGEPAFRVRGAADSYDAAVSGGVATPAFVRQHVAEFLRQRGSDGECLLSCFPVGEDLRRPDPEDLIESLGPHLMRHASYVASVLKARRVEALDRVREAIRELDDAGVTPTPLAGAVPKVRSPAHPPDGRPRSVRPGKVGDRDTGKIGARGEAWALGAVVRPLEQLLADDPVRFATVVTELRNLLTRHWKDAVVDSLAAHADEAVNPALSVDERMDALVKFLHLSKASDDFGCDMLGWLPPTTGSEPRALALEVKSTATRSSVLVSRNEWDEARRLGPEYALVVVLRKASSIHAMDVIQDPCSLVDAALALTADTWKISYGLPKPSEGIGAASHAGTIALPDAQEGVSSEAVGPPDALA